MAQTNEFLLNHGENAPSPVTRVFVSGYYDGPTNGVLQLGLSGPVYQFDLTDEDVQSPDSRKYLLRRLPGDTLSRIVDLLAPYHPPTWPVWCPNWKFPSECIRGEVEDALDLLLEKAGSAEWEIETADWMTFSRLNAQSMSLVAG